MTAEHRDIHRTIKLAPGDYLVSKRPGGAANSDSVTLTCEEPVEWWIRTDDHYYLEGAGKWLVWHKWDLGAGDDIVVTDLDGKRAPRFPESIFQGPASVGLFLQNPLVAEVVFRGKFDLPDIQRVALLGVLR